jgi:hypothetical protein
MGLTSKRKNYSNATGRTAEVRFRRAAEDLGLIVRKSTSYEDINLHVDFWLSTEGDQEWGVDVKGNNLPDEVWVEFMNVSGNPGWMYGGAHIIAFDMPEEGGFVVVNRTDLVDFCEKNVEDIIVKDKRDSYKKKYRRRDRMDLITKLNLLDLRRITSFRIWKYFRDY